MKWVSYGLSIAFGVMSAARYSSDHELWAAIARGAVLIATGVMLTRALYAPAEEKRRWRRGLQDLWKRSTRRRR